ncbi:MAG: carboxypeptidase-like regulatory domain-containing protein, partial [Woeseiaceae bacterium]
MNVKRRWWHLLPALFLVSMNAQGAIGEGTGNIVGSLQNRTDATYTVNATDQSTGRSRDNTVGEDGDFRFAQLPVGSYVVTVSRDGTVVARDTFAVTLNGNTSAVFVLEDAGALEEITVTAARTTSDTYTA